jgi:mRNA interferase MazF
MNYKWSIFIADLNPVQGSERRGKRPVLVISDEDFNKHMPVVTVLPVTSLKEGRKVYPNESLLKKEMANLAQDSLVLAHQIRTISKQRLKDPLGFIGDHGAREMINGALRVQLNL